MSSPQRYTKGVTNAESSDTFGQLIIPDPTSVHVFMDDFDKFDPGDWIITRVETGGSSEGSEALTDADGGVLAVTNNDADDNSIFLQWKGSSNKSTAAEIFTLASTKKLWFKARFKVSDTGDSDFIVGLQNADTTPMTAPGNAVYFKSDDGDDNLDFEVYKSDVVKLSDTAVATLTDDTYLTVGFYWDGVDTIEYFVDGSSVGSSQGIAYPTAEMTVSFGVQNGSAASRVMSVDYICVIKER